jgi:hypothetical protein
MHRVFMGNWNGLPQQGAAAARGTVARDAHVVLKLFQLVPWRD